MKNFFLFISALAITSFTHAMPQEWSAKVINVIDGNTLEILTSDDETYKVMLKEVDCPEIGQSFGEEAKKLTEKILLKKKVKVIIQGKDRWGNRLVTIELNNGKNINEELMKKGFAWQNPRMSSDSNLRSLQATAQTSKIGIWTEDSPTPPWVYRRQQTMLQPKSR